MKWLGAAPVLAVVLHTGVLQAAPADLCAKGAKPSAGLSEHCIGHGGWRFNARGWQRDIPAKQNGTIATYKCSVAVCGATLRLKAWTGNQDIVLPTTRDAYLQSLNVADLERMAWDDSEDDVTPLVHLQPFSGKTAFRMAAFRVTPQAPRKPYERLVAITFGRDLIYIFTVTTEPGGIARSKRHVDDLLASVEVKE